MNIQYKTSYHNSSPSLLVDRIFMITGFSENFRHGFLQDSDSSLNSPITAICHLTDDADRPFMRKLDKTTRIHIFAKKYHAAAYF